MVGEDSSVNLDVVKVMSDIEDNVEVGFLPSHPPFENCASKFESRPKLR